MPPASREVSLIIKFYFVSFVLFVLIFLSRYNLLSLCENVLYRVSPFLRSRPPRLQTKCALPPPRKVGLMKDGNKVAKNFSPHFWTGSPGAVDIRGPDRIVSAKIGEICLKYEYGLSVGS